MKILQMNFEKGWRGGERQTLFSMQEFRKAGHEVALLTRANNELAKQAIAEGFTVYTRQKAWQQLPFLIRHGKQFDIIHSQTANTLTWAVLAKLFSPAKVVFTRRTAFPIAAKKERMTRFKWKKADLFVSIAQAAAQEPRRLGIETIIIPSAIQPRPVNSQRANTLRLELNPDNRIILGTAAALTKEKDPLTLIRAIAHLHKQRQDFIFIHFGADGDQTLAAKALITELHLENTYLLAGFHEQVEDYYSLLKVFVMSSRHEALGSSVLDAFLQHVPVVSTNAGGLKEVLADGRGILCDIGDDKALAKGIDTLLNHPEDARIMTEKAYAYVMDEHNVQKMGQRYLQAYEKLLATSH
ncbi:glycosyltransferase family 4 protein [Advenella sp. RU8]|uniref:glycosyltransferase family 4 protein n=1 Tax=Advenella sp. RU8 TaxID=3399575 RepID=UPI003AB0FFC6